jgi:hypothetical protein
MTSTGRIMDPALRVAFVLVTATSLLLPSGSVFGLNVKMWLVVVVSGIVTLHLLVRGRVNGLWMLAVLAFSALLVWGLLVAQARGVRDQASLASQIVALLSVFSVFMLLAYIVVSGAIGAPQALRHVVTVVMIYAAMKLLLEALFLLRILSLEEALVAIAFVFGVGFIRLDTGTLIRVNFPADLVLPIALLYVIARWGQGHGADSMTRWRRLAGGVIILGAIVVAYSRYLWFATALLVFYWYVVTAARPRIWHLGWLSALTAVTPFLWGPLVRRFTGEAAATSDLARKEMFGVITDRINEYPLVGSGLGFYLETLVRIPTSPWYYEFQWLALWMQLGFIGLIVVLLLCVPVLNGMRLTATGVGIALGYLVWLASGLVNGFLLTSSAGVVFFIYWVMVRNDGATRAGSRILSSAVPSRE